MIRAEIVAPFAIAAFLLASTLAAGPTMGVGAVFALLLLWGIYLYPILGLGLMIVAGTSLQVLGSEHITGLPVSIGKAAGALTLLAWMARTLVSRNPLTYTPQYWALAAFGVSLVVTGTRIPDPATAQDGVFRYAQLLLLFMMLTNIAADSRKTLDRACLVLTVSMVISVVIACLEFFLPSLALDFDDPDLVQGAVGAILDTDSIEGVTIKRVTGGLSDSNWFAFTLASVLPINLYLYHRYRDAGVRALVAGAAAFQAFGIVLSLTRSGILSVGVAVLVLVIKRRLALVPIALAASIGAAGFILWNPPGLQRLFSTEYLEEGSTPLRQAFLRGGLALIAQDPIVGYGYNQFGPNFVRWIRTQPVGPSVQEWEQEFSRRSDEGLERAEDIMTHNTFIQIWVEFGLLGILAFVAFVAFIFRDLAVVRRHGSPSQHLLADCLYAGTVAFLVSGMFGVLAMLKLVWLLGGLAAALRRLALVGDAFPAASLPAGAPAAGEPVGNPA